MLDANRPTFLNFKSFEFWNRYEKILASESKSNSLNLKEFSYWNLANFRQINKLTLEKRANFWKIDDKVQRVDR